MITRIEYANASGTRTAIVERLYETRWRVLRQWMSRSGRPMAIELERPSLTSAQSNARTWCAKAEGGPR